MVGLLLRGQTGSVQTSSGIWTSEEEPGLTQHQRLGNLHRKGSQVRSVDSGYVGVYMGFYNEFP